MCPVCPVEQRPRERAQRSGGSPLPRDRTEQLPHPAVKPQEPHCFLALGKGDRRDLQKDVINTAFLPRLLWVGNSLLTTPKSYRDPLYIGTHITPSSEPLCNTAGSPSPTTSNVEYPTASQAVFSNFQSPLPSLTCTEWPRLSRGLPLNSPQLAFTASGCNLVRWGCAAGVGALQSPWPCPPCLGHAVIAEGI